MLGLQRDAALWPVITHPSRGLRKINRKPQTPTIPHATYSKLQMCRRAGAMLTREDYRQLAEQCALLAGECGAPGVAEALRALALNYLTRAASQKQQQMQGLSR